MPNIKIIMCTDYVIKVSYDTDCRGIFKAFSEHGKFCTKILSSGEVSGEILKFYCSGLLLGVGGDVMSLELRK